MSLIFQILNHLVKAFSINWRQGSVFKRNELFHIKGRDDFYYRSRTRGIANGIHMCGAFGAFAQARVWTGPGSVTGRTTKLPPWIPERKPAILSFDHSSDCVPMQAHSSMSPGDSFNALYLMTTQGQLICVHFPFIY